MIEIHCTLLVFVLLKIACSSPVQHVHENKKFYCNNYVSIFFIMNHYSTNVILSFHGHSGFFSATSLLILFHYFDHIVDQGIWTLLSMSFSILFNSVIGTYLLVGMCQGSS